MDHSAQGSSDHGDAASAASEGSLKPLEAEPLGPSPQAYEDTRTAGSFSALQYDDFSRIAFNFQSKTSGSMSLSNLGVDRETLLEESEAYDDEASDIFSTGFVSPRFERKKLSSKKQNKPLKTKSDQPSSLTLGPLIDSEDQQKNHSVSGKAQSRNHRDRERRKDHPSDKHRTRNNENPKNHHHRRREQKPSRKKSSKRRHHPTKSRSIDEAKSSDNMSVEEELLTFLSFPPDTQKEGYHRVEELSKSPELTGDQESHDDDDVKFLPQSPQPDNNDIVVDVITKTPSMHFEGDDDDILLSHLHAGDPQLVKLQKEKLRELPLPLDSHDEEAEATSTSPIAIPKEAQEFEEETKQLQFSAQVRLNPLREKKAKMEQMFSDQSHKWFDFVKQSAQSLLHKQELEKALEEDPDILVLKKQISEKEQEISLAKVGRLKARDELGKMKEEQNKELNNVMQHPLFQQLTLALRESLIKSQQTVAQLEPELEETKTKVLEMRHAEIMMDRTIQETDKELARVREQLEEYAGMEEHLDAVQEDFDVLENSLEASRERSELLQKELDDVPGLLDDIVAAKEAAAALKEQLDTEQAKLPTLAERQAVRDQDYVKVQTQLRLGVLEKQNKKLEIKNELLELRTQQLKDTQQLIQELQHEHDELEHQTCCPVHGETFYNDQGLPYYRDKLGNAYYYDAAGQVQAYDEMNDNGTA